MSPRKSLSETSLSARRKRAVFKAFALSLLILFLVSLWDKPEGYVERFIPYAFVQSPSRVYRHDEIDEGKDYNVISVYAVSADADGEGFLRFLETSADWNPLPLTPDMLAQPLLAERFDTHIDDMLAVWLQQILPRQLLPLQNVLDISFQFVGIHERVVSVSHLQRRDQP